jgi:anti-sigma regulatory factor (Ser/Thr protein kinase)
MADPAGSFATGSQCLFTASVEDCAYARRMVHSAFEGITPSVVATAQLLASEVVANAMVHASGDPILTLDLRDESIHVEVTDAGPISDLQPLQVNLTSPHGRGLAIVDALASSWGCEPRSGGKAVWFRLEILNPP